jgi:hypothetical protein
MQSSMFGYREGRPKRMDHRINGSSNPSRCQPWMAATSATDKIKKTKKTKKTRLRAVVGRAATDSWIDEPMAH